MHLQTLDEVEDFIVSNVSKEIDVLPPEHPNIKGCGKHIKRRKKKAMEQQQMITRLFIPRKQFVYHDSHNCPQNYLFKL